MALAAKAGLTFDEIVSAYAKRRTRIANCLLDVSRDGPEQRFLCGANPHFSARAIRLTRPTIKVDERTAHRVCEASNPRSTRPRLA